MVSAHRAHGIHPIYGVIPISVVGEVRKRGGSSSAPLPPLEWDHPIYGVYPMCMVGRDQFPQSIRLTIPPIISDSNWNVPPQKSPVTHPLTPQRILFSVFRGQALRIVLFSFLYASLLWVSHSFKELHLLGAKKSTSIIKMNTIQYSVH